MNAIRRESILSYWRLLAVPSYGDYDLEPIYNKADMSDPEIQAKFRARLEDLRAACWELARQIAAAADFAPEDLGL